LVAIDSTRPLAPAVNSPRQNTEQDNNGKTDQHRDGKAEQQITSVKQRPWRGRKATDEINTIHSLYHLPAARCDCHTQKVMAPMKRAA